MPAINLQDRKEEYPELEEVLVRSETDWLGRQDVLDISDVNPTVSDEPVVQFQEGLYRFHGTSAFDGIEWERYDPKKTKEVPPLRYTLSRVELTPQDAAVRSFYERRVYKPPAPLALYGGHVLVHYRILHFADDGTEIPDSGEDTTASSENGSDDGSGSSDNSDDPVFNVTIEFKMKMKITLH